LCHAGGFSHEVLAFATGRRRSLDFTLIFEKKYLSANPALAWLPQK
jgi:hypothetical protein